MSSRKRKLLNLEEKVKVIQLTEKGESSRILAEKFDVGKTQINNIVKDRETILQKWEGGMDGERKIVRARRCLYPDLNDKVFELFCTARAKKIPLTGRLIQEKATILSVEMGHDDFTASNGWLHRFQVRHNIKCSVLSGESADVNDEVVEDWKTRLNDICRGYDRKDIFNCDETGLFFRLLPTRSLVQKGELCNGGKKAKERFTVLLCASCSGEKLKPLVIGKSQNPRCFKGYSRAHLRVTYEANRKAWMTGQIFQSWIKKLNQQMKVQNRKILLFLDNCAAHPKLDLSNVKVSYFPPNTTSKLQPLDAGIIQTVKVHYRKKLLRHVLFLMDNIASASEIAKKVTLLDAIQWLTSAWDILTAETIQKCFRKCGFFHEVSDVPQTEEEDWDEEDYLPLIPPGTTLKDYIQCDDALATENAISDDWESLIIEDARHSNETCQDKESDSDTCDNQNPAKQCIPLQTAWIHSTELMDYGLATNNVELVDIMIKTQDILKKDKRKAIESMGQMKIDNFFKPKNS